MKFIIVFIHALTVAIYQFFFGNPVTVVAKMPEAVASGKNFTLEVTVNKVEISKFAILQLEIPAEFTASEVDSKGGSFTASGNVIKIIWASIPSDSELTIKVNIGIPASSNGDKQIQGKFSFLENNVKQQAALTPISFNLSSDIAKTSKATKINENRVNSVQAISESGRTLVSANRKITSLSEPNSFQVDVVIKKGNVKGFAQLLEKIPAGYKAESISTDNGTSFDFSGGEAKFVWLSVPSDGEMEVSYKLVPDVGVTPQNPSYNPGASVFSYVENNQPKKVAIDGKN